MIKSFVRRVESVETGDDGQIVEIYGVRYATPLRTFAEGDLVVVLPSGIALPSWLAAKVVRTHTLDGAALLPLSYREFDQSELFGPDAKDYGWVLEVPEELNGVPGFVVYEGLDVAGLLKLSTPLDA